MDRRGVTFNELIVALGIVSVVVSLAGFEFQGWQQKYRQEFQIRQLYADLMTAKAEAKTRRRRYLVVFDSATPKRYDVYEDADNDGVPYPDGDDLHMAKLSKDYSDEPFSDFSHNLASDPLVLTFNKLGLANRLFTIRIPDPSSKEPEYDCITVHRSRINPGKHNGKKCVHAL